MGGPDFKEHLMVGAEIDRLNVLPGRKVPEMH
jgi:hypothetical protein